MPPEATAPVVLWAQLGPRSPQGAPRRRSQASPGPTRRPAYVARLLALAHRLRGLLDRGEVERVGELARRLGVSQPRVSQLVALTYLAPSIQTEIAALEAVDGVEPMSERPLREVLRAVGWRGQCETWEAANPTAGNRQRSLSSQLGQHVRLDEPSRQHVPGVRR